MVKIPLQIKSEVIQINSLELILENIPTVLQYFIPGYWFIFIFTFCTKKKLSKNIILILSCTISYLLISCLEIVRISTKIIKIPDTTLINSGIAIILATLLAIVVSCVVSCKTYSSMLVKLFHKTPNDNIWMDLLDFNSGSNLKIYLKNENYYVIGHHKNQEENRDDSWLAVSAFAKFDKTTNELCENEPSFLDNEDVTYVVRFSDIEHIEIFNTK